MGFVYAYVDDCMYTWDMACIADRIAWKGRVALRIGLHGQVMLH